METLFASNPDSVQELFRRFPVAQMGKTCGVGIVPGYVKHVAKYAEFLWVDPDTDNARASAAFAFAHTLKSNDLHLTLICSKKAGAGQRLLKEFVIPFATSQGYNGIQIESVYERVGYYQKFGFLIGVNCETTNATLTQEASIMNPHGKPYNTYEEFKTDPRAAKLIQQSVEKGFVHDAPMCKKKKLSDEDCAAEGLDMYLCLKKPHNPTAKPLLVKKTRTKRATTVKRKTPTEDFEQSGPARRRSSGRLRYASAGFYKTYF
jgi:hypothetical protein